VRAVKITGPFMIIDQACGLEEGIDSDGADKLEASFFHVLGNLLR
jgi:hypothetical protein